MPRLTGIARSLEIIAFDDPIFPEKALEYGLINLIVNDDELIAESEKLINKIFSVSLNSFGISKQLIYDSFSNTFESQLEHERIGLSACADHSDGREGIRAFIEKRRPRYL